MNPKRDLAGGSIHARAAWMSAVISGVVVYPCILRPGASLGGHACALPTLVFSEILLCDCPAGKSLPIFRSRVKSGVSENQKYTASVFPQICGITPFVSPRDEGRWPSSLTRGEMRWTRMP